MPREGLRFVHTTNLFLDHQLRDAGPLSDSIRPIVEDAALTAFERVIAACVDHEVDFLLLVGNSFTEKDRSLRARVALLKGFEQLGQRDIQVFVVPGPADPAAAWRAIPDIPSHVTLFLDDGSEPVAALRDGTVIASIVSLDPDSLPAAGSRAKGHTQGVSKTPVTSARFSIGLMGAQTKRPLQADAWGSQESLVTANERFGEALSDVAASHEIDYLALGGGCERTTIGLERGVAHDPGGTQGLHPSETGAHGCTLVDVDSDGTVRCTTIPTAPVRWERLAVDINDGTNQDELVIAMHCALTERRPEPTEKVWLIDWVITGSGPLFDLLAQEAVRSEVIALLEASEPLPEGLLQSHRFHRMPPCQPADSDSQRNHFARQYFERLDGELPLSPETLHRLLERADLPAGGWSGRIESLLGDLDLDTIGVHARRHGMGWLAKSQVEGTAS